jgi:HEAT repeat protein
VVTAPEVGLLAVGWAAAALLLAALLFGALMFLSWRHRRADVHAAGLRQSLAPMFAGWAERAPAPAELEWLARLSRGDGRIVLVACLEALPELASAAAERVREALRGSGLAGREVALLRHRSAARRVEGCRFAGRLRDTGAVPLLVERLRDDDLEVRRESTRALGELRAVEALGDIDEAIEAMSDWGNLLLVMALIRMGPASAPRIGALLAGSKSPAMTKALLQVTGRLGVAADPAMVRALASHPDPEIRVEAVRVLGAIVPDPESSAVCLAAMDDPQWPVRALAAWSLGRVGDARAIARLAGAMGDPAYWVRHHVAEAMAALGERGEAALRGGLEDENPFVRDMAAQTLFMRGLAEGEAA